MSDSTREADTLLRQHDEPTTAKQRGYAYGGKARTKYLPDALPNTWAPGDPVPSVALAYDPAADDDPSAERGSDGDDNANSPLEQMSVDDQSGPLAGVLDDPEHGKFRGPPWPDRKTDPYGWEMFFRGMMRASPWSMRQTPWTLAKAMLGNSSVCRYCGDEFEQAETGRPREYCKDTCKMKASRERRTRRVPKLG